MGNSDDKINVPYIVYEGTQARMERTAKRLLIALIISIILLFTSNLFWLWAWQQYDYTSESYIQDGAGYNNINTGGQGDVINGADVQTENPDEKER